MKSFKKLVAVTMACLCVLTAPMTALANNTDSLNRYSYDKAQMTSDQQQYEIKRYTYSKTHKALNPVSTITRPRYTQSSDGIYRTSSVAKDKKAMIMFTGDLMCQGRQQTSVKEKYGKYYFNYSFTYAKRAFKTVDFVVGNLETTLSESASYMSEESKVGNLPHCNAPSTYLDALRYAGFDMVVQANNHNLDAGIKGIYETQAHLDQYGLIHTGLFTNKNEKRYIVVEIDGIKVGFLSYSTKFNGKDKNLTSEGQNIFLNRYSKAKCIKDVKAAKAAGAEYIVAYNHWGTEYQTSVTALEKQYAKEMADAGVDFIIGSHPHVLQKYSTVTSATGKKVPVMYSLGNFVSHMTKTNTKETAILRITLKRNSSGKVYLSGKSYIPCHCYTSFKSKKYVVVPLTLPYGKGLATSYNSTYSRRVKNIIGTGISRLGKLATY